MPHQRSFRIFKTHFLRRNTLRSLQQNKIFCPNMVTKITLKSFYLSINSRSLENKYQAISEQLWASCAKGITPSLSYFLSPTSSLLFLNLLTPLSYPLSITLFPLSAISPILLSFPLYPPFVSSLSRPAPSLVSSLPV